MFTWITGPRITNVIEDLQTDPAYDTTFIEPPETPAPQFAVKAFKRALFGTPAPEEANPGKKPETKAKLDAANAKATVLPAPKENAPPSSPSKQPNGILMTPRTANKGRKTVSFGSHVVDNEGKRGTIGKSGIPNDCPGKFPSPWTPGTELKVDEGTDSKPRTKLTAALYDARTTTQPKLGQKPKARDDSDITIDLGAPRSESGKYWKEQYENYAERSEKQMKQLVSKHQVAKNYAMKKDAEAMEAATRLAEERKRFRVWERELEQQNKDLQERLRQAMGDNVAASVESAALRSRVETLEKSLVTTSGLQNSKMSFQIYEDSNKDSSQLLLDQEKVIVEARSRDTMEPPSIILGKPVQSTRVSPEDKENSPPKPRHVRRQTLPDSSSRPVVSRSGTSPAGTESIEASAMLANSPYVSEFSAKPTLEPRSSELPSNSPLRARRIESSKENLPPKSPVVTLSSPLPQPSPDPWMQFGDSPAPAMDRLALPISSGISSSRPTKTNRLSQPLRRRASKAISQAAKVDSQKTERQATKPEGPQATRNTAPKSSTPQNGPPSGPKTSKSPTEKSAPKDSKFDVARVTSHHAEGSSLVKKDRVTLPVDRREEAKRRLQERAERKARKSGGL